MKGTSLLALSICILCGVAFAGQQDEVLDINARVAQLDVNSSTVEDVKLIFGKPLKYIWGRDEFAESELPSKYIAVYRRGMSVVIVNDHVHELRFEAEETGYLFKGKIHIGSSLDEVLDVLGQPKETVEGKPIGWKADVLYKDAEGKKGLCYYRSGQHNVRMFFRLRRNGLV